MKPINLKNVEAYEKLSVAIKEAEGHATVRKITASDIIDSLDSVVKTLAISKKSMEGIEVSVDLNAQKFPNTYKYAPESTHFRAIYKSGSWRITKIWRDTCIERKPIRIYHTESSLDALLERFTYI